MTCRSKTVIFSSNSWIFFYICPFKKKLTNSIDFLQFRTIFQNHSLSHATTLLKKPEKSKVMLPHPLTHAPKHRKSASKHLPPPRQIQALKCGQSKCFVSEEIFDLLAFTGGIRSPTNGNGFRSAARYD